MQVRNYIAYAIPFFLVAIGLELAVARARRRRGLYRVGDALADLGCGVGQQLAMVFAGAVILAGYASLYDRFRLHTFASGSPWPWLLAFVVVDVMYYWWHRLSHEVNILWAGHGVHHQSEDYNLAVALRQSVITAFTALPFYYPMAFVGVPPVVYATTVALSTLYQFWIHTELVGRLGWLEAWLNTPSHHRVHHAVNPQYLDRNYGAVLIVWDRLFGTFEPEVAPPVYGTTKPLASFNPVWAQVQLLFEIAEKGRGLRGWDRVALWFRSPAWSPGSAAPPSEAELRARPKYDVPLAPAVQLYAVVQFAPLVVATFLMLLWQYTAPAGALAIAAALSTATLFSLGALLDGRRWAVPVELARLAVCSAGAAAWAAPALGTGPALALSAALAVGSALWLLRAGRASLAALGPAAPALGACAPGEREG